MSDTKWLSITGFSDQLGLSRHTVEGLVKTGELNVFDISPGRKRPTYRLPPSELSTALSIMRADISPATQEATDEPTVVRDAC